MDVDCQKGLVIHLTELRRVQRFCFVQLFLPGHCDGPISREHLLCRTASSDLFEVPALVWSFEDPEHPGWCHERPRFSMECHPPLRSSMIPEATSLGMTKLRACAYTYIILYIYIHRLYTCIYIHIEAAAFGGGGPHLTLAFPDSCVSAQVAES